MPINKDKKKKLINRLEMISDDAEKDAKHYEGQEFNGRNVAEYFGKHGASIAALANTIKELIEEDKCR